MPLELTSDRAVLTGHVAIEDTEPLLDWLRDGNAGSVDVTACTSMHMAILQLLLRISPPIDGADTDDWRQLLKPQHSYRPNN